MAPHNHSDSEVAHHGSDHSAMYYIKIYFILLVLLIVSILGPELNIRSLTLITAFGIAIVKALMVAAYFMHLNIEKRYIWYMLYSMLILVGVFFAGTAADVMRIEGRNWEATATKEFEKQKAKEHAQSSGHGDTHGESKPEAAPTEPAPPVDHSEHGHDK